VVRDCCSSSAIILMMLPGSQSSQQFPLRPMDWDSGSSQCLEVAKSWLENCVEKHEECVEGDTTLPSRILDVSSLDNIITLVDGTDRSGRYASLSYCVSISVSLTPYPCSNRY
jgi:hypothetical protein